MLEQRMCHAKSILDDLHIIYLHLGWSQIPCRYLVLSPLNIYVFVVYWLRARSFSPQARIIEALLADELVDGVSMP